MGQGDNATMIRYKKRNDDGCDEEEEDDSTPMTLDVIAREQKADNDLAKMIHRAPSGECCVLIFIVREWIVARLKC